MKQNAYDEYCKQKIARYGEDKAKTWRLLNEIMNRKKKKREKINILVDCSGKRHERKLDIVNCLNDHFSSIGEKMAAKFTTKVESDV